MERWHRQGRLTYGNDNPNLIAERVIRRLRFSATNLPPKVHAAHFKTLWNGWCTDRRFQKLTKSQGCKFGCGVPAQDSIEHYSCCPTVLRFHEFLHLPSRGTKLANFLGTCEEGREGELIVRFIALYACYQAHNIISHTQRPLEPFNLLKEGANCAVMGDDFNSRWLVHFRSGFRSPMPSKGGTKRTKTAINGRDSKTSKGQPRWSDS